MGISDKIRRILINILTSNVAPLERKSGIRKELNALCLKKKEQIQQKHEPMPEEGAPRSISDRLEQFPRLTLVFDHHWGGGANLYSDRRIRQILDDGGSAARVICIGQGERHFELTVYSGDDLTKYYFYSLLALEQLVQHKVDYIIVNELASWKLPYDNRILPEFRCEGVGNDIPELLEQIVYLGTQAGVGIEHCFHDFFPVCPTINLLNEHYRYCGVECDEKVCRNCLTNHHTRRHKYLNITRWRQAWQYYFDHVEKVQFFSNDTKERALKAYVIPTDKLVVTPHAPLNSFDVIHHIGTDGAMVVGVVGDIARHKGSEFIIKLGEVLAQRSKKDRIIVIGTLEGKYSTSNITVTGRYKRDDLPAILKRHKVTIACIPSICPETFSYVTQELMQLEVPLVCFPLGAPAERIGDWEKGLVAQDVSAEALYVALKDLDKRRLRS